MVGLGAVPHADHGLQAAALPQRPASGTALGDLQIEVVGVVSNHLDAEPLVKSHGLDFHHLPVTPDTKADAEVQLMALVEQHEVHLVVLARYMQILSDGLCRRLSGRAINIHHSFLPSFKGAKPYHRRSSAA